MTHKWAVMVTTAPRREPTLQICVDSLRDCGWEPTVLAEPESPIVDCLTIHNEYKLGVWRNWVKSVRLALETDAEVIMTVQDDSLFHPESKIFTESIMWPANNCGFISLYTPKHYSFDTKKKLKPPGVHKVITRSLWGACALVFPRRVLEHVIKSTLIDSWLGANPKSRNPAVLKKRKDNPSLIANSDTAIGKLMNWNKYTMWFVDPSPVQHIARFSAIGHGGNEGRRNCYRPADHSLPLSYQVPLP